MARIIIDVIKVVIDLVERAFAGDEEAHKKVSEILPDPLKSELAKAAADAAAEAKFGGVSGLENG